MSSQMLVDGSTRKVADVLKDALLYSLLSDEGPIDAADIRRVSEWKP